MIARIAGERRHGRGDRRSLSRFNHVVTAPLEGRDNFFGGPQIREEPKGFTMQAEARKSICDKADRLRISLAVKLVALVDEVAKRVVQQEFAVVVALDQVDATRKAIEYYAGRRVSGARQYSGARLGEKGSEFQ
jgi:hypothetical protein